MERIAEKHKSLINGLTTLYDTLIAMHYITASHVIRPPHAPQTIITHHLGFDAEVMDLISLIPLLRSDVTWGWQNEGIQLVPRSKAVTYLADPNPHELIDDLRWGDFYKYPGNETRLLSPWMLRLTSSGDYGVNIIYNTRDQKVIEWSHMGTKMWDEVPSRPTEHLFSEMIEKLESLEWVPYLDPDSRGWPPSREIVENPLIFQNIWPGGIRVPMDPVEAIKKVRQELNQQSVDRMRQDINRWRALQKLYRDCGWGSASFDGETFETKRAEWIGAVKRMDKERERLTLVPGWQVTGQKPLSKEFVDEWEEFWTESAGEHAV